MCKDGCLGVCLGVSTNYYKEEGVGNTKRGVSLTWGNKCNVRCFKAPAHL